MEILIISTIAVILLIVFFLKEKIAKLEADLEEARKNDHRGRKKAATKGKK